MSSARGAITFKRRDTRPIRSRLISPEDLCQPVVRDRLWQGHPTIADRLPCAHLRIVAASIRAFRMPRCALVQIRLSERKDRA